MNVTTVGIDLAKNVFSVHGVDSHGKVVLKKTVSRSKLLECFANLPPAIIGMEACSGAQALNALVFLYDSVLQKPLGELAGLKRVQQRHRVPVVLSREEVKAILEQMTGVPRLMAELMYGAGLRVGECMTLRVKDIDFSAGGMAMLLFSP